MSVKDLKDKVAKVEELETGVINILSRSLKFRGIQIPPRIDIFRVMIVAKAYNISFLNRETLEKLMAKELKSKFQNKSHNRRDFYVFSVMG